MPIIVIILLTCIGIFAIFTSREKQKEIERTGKYPEGHFVGLGIVLGAGLGIAIGVSIGNIALGLAIGLAIGVSIGISLEKKYKKRIRPLTEKEKKVRKLTILIGIIILLIGIGAFLLTIKGIL